MKDDDIDGLVRFYYNITNCLATLTRMKYDSDLGSSEVVKLAVNRLPNRLQGKWKEFSYSIRKRHEEVTIRHLEHWLKDRIMAARDPHFSNTSTPKTDKSVSFKEKISTLLTYRKILNISPPEYKPP